MRGVNQDLPCHCATRAIFAIVHARFRAIQDSGPWGQAHRLLTDTAPATNKPGNGGTMRRQHFCADFILIARRVLSEPDYRVFRFHFLLGADWKLCARRLGVNKGNFFHAVYRVQSKLGRAYAEIEPYSLFPIDGYFGSGLRAHGVRPSTPATVPRERKNGVTCSIAPPAESSLTPCTETLLPDCHIPALKTRGQRQ